MICQHSSACGLCPSFDIQKNTKEHTVSEIVSIIFFWPQVREWETPTLLGMLELTLVAGVSYL
jgi:hypothetical protein